MPKTCWGEVLERTNERRNAGRNVNLNVISRLTGDARAIAGSREMYAFVKMLGTLADNQPTLAFGILAHGGGVDILYVAKGGAEGLPEQFEQALQASAACLGNPNYLKLIGNESGLHAEMRIIGEVFTRFAVVHGIPKAQIGRYLYIVCVGKEVCRDCAGWMNMHDIGHCSYIPGRSNGIVEHEAGGVSTMGGGIWRHPIYGTAYGGGNDLNSYSAHDRTTGKLTTLNPTSKPAFTRKPPRDRSGS